MSNKDHKIIETREEALEAIIDLRKKYDDSASKLSEANEATTRLLIIDNVLKILGWAEEDFNPETSISKLSYIDYLLKIENIPRLIVEAKKVNYTFGSPDGKLHKSHYQLRYFRSAFRQAFTEVLDQAKRYSLETRVPYALLTNGVEWVLLQLHLTPGFDSFDDLRGVYFGNLFSDDFHFDNFWNILHRSYVNEGSIESYLSELNSKEAEYSRSPQAQFGSLKWRPNLNSQNIQEFYHLFFDEIVDPGRRNMLEKCFVITLF